MTACTLCKPYWKNSGSINRSCNVNILFPGWCIGSYARGEARADSDIDIAAEITAPMGLAFVAMADEIENLFGAKTDVVPLRSIKQQYLPSVQKDIVYA